MKNFRILLAGIVGFASVAHASDVPVIGSKAQEIKTALAASLTQNTFACTDATGQATWWNVNNFNTMMSDPATFVFVSDDQSQPAITLKRPYAADASDLVVFTTSPDFKKVVSVAADQEIITHVITNTGTLLDPVLTQQDVSSITHLYICKL